MNEIITIFLSVIAIAGLYELHRKNRIPKSAPKESGTYVTAAESGPTETGRYRLEQMFNKSKPNLRPGSIVGKKDAALPDDESYDEDNTEGKGEQAPLPDPFSSK